MAIKQTHQRGFTLLIAVIFMSVMLAFGLALSSISYKQQVLASAAIESQYAFYAADAGLECALYADQQTPLFAYQSTAPSPAPVAQCDNQTPVSASDTCSPSRCVATNRFSLDSGTRCVDITIYKPNPSSNAATYIFSQGYDVSCATVTSSPTGARIVTRGINILY